MISKSTLNFLEDLKLKNSKEWLDQNRQGYEEAKNDILSLAADLVASLSEIDTTISNAYLDPKKCITRLNRDLRFSKDKTPYKTEYYIVLNKFGKNSPAAFYFLHIEPDNCFVGGGVYNPQPEQLKKIRKEIDYSFGEWTSLISDTTFKNTFPGGIHNSGVLSKTPKEFGDENPAAEFLKMKGFYTMEKLTDLEIVSNDSLMKINSCFKNSKPLVDFLNRAIEIDL
jgi:uncharacterized protein (TIGR02453 family)